MIPKVVTPQVIIVTHKTGDHRLCIIRVEALQAFRYRKFLKACGATALKSKFRALSQSRQED